MEVLRGREGLLHFTELSHRLSKPVHELLTVGQQVKVRTFHYQPESEDGPYYSHPSDSDRMRGSRLVF